MTYSNFKQQLDNSVACQQLLIPFYENAAYEGRFVFMEKDRKYNSEIVDIVQNAGCDTVLQTKRGAIGIEEKFRAAWTRKKEDLAFETWSCTVPTREKRGWGFTSKADFLNYIFVMDKYLDCFLIEMKKLRQLYEEGKENWNIIRTNQINRTESALIPLFNIKTVIGYYNKKLPI